MDPLLIAVAFVCGFLAKAIKLPPLVGFLAAGFVLHGLGFDGGAQLQLLADAGVTLLLFSIGLKLDVRGLARPEVWAGAGLHMLLAVGLFGLALLGLGHTSLPVFGGLGLESAALIAFALSFSSTVFAVQILAAKGEGGALHGRTAIGVLIVQDLFAVGFLTASAKALPGWSVLALPPALWASRWVLFKALDRCGHGEVLALFGLLAALVVGGAGFKSVGLKPDLGALVVGALLAKHPKSGELAAVLLELKELLLVGFFLTIGLSGFPTLSALGVAALLLTVVPLKAALFYLLLVRFRLRARSALLGSLTLANYSEFGLIVVTVGAARGWVGSEWLGILAIALAATFVIGAPLNTLGDAIYTRYRERLRRLETSTLHPDDQPIDPGAIQVAIFGMGKVGTAAYEALSGKSEHPPLGFDFNRTTVAAHTAAGRRVLYGDPTDPDFWARLGPPPEGTRLAVLALRDVTTKLSAAAHLRSVGFRGVIAAAANFDDEVRALREAGVDVAYNLYHEAGVGLSQHAWRALEARQAKPA